VIGFGFSCLAIGLTWLSVVMTPSTAIWELVLPFFVLGAAGAFVWAPITATATRSLPLRFAGASSGVFNATRQVGAVLGSAGMASFMTSRIGAELGPMPDGGARPAGGPGSGLEMPAFLHEPFAAAMSQSMLLPAFVALFGIGSALFMVGSAGSNDDERRRARDRPMDSLDAPTRRVRVRPSAAEGFASNSDGYRDGFDDDDDYVEYRLSPAPESAPRPARPAQPPPGRVNEALTEPFASRRQQARPAPVESWRDLLDDTTTTMEIEPIEIAHNGFEVGDDRRFGPVEEFPPLEHGRAEADEPFFDDIDTYGGSTSHDNLRNGHHRPPPGRRRRTDPEEGPGRHYFPHA
jgi:hypothetical protein